jgi:hypothetical protein
METAIPARERRGFIGLTGFEPATFRTRGERSTKLSHSPNCAPREIQAAHSYFAHFGRSSKLYRAPNSREDHDPAKSLNAKQTQPWSAAMADR